MRSNTIRITRVYAYDVSGLKHEWTRLRFPASGDLRMVGQVHCPLGRALEASCDPVPLVINSGRSLSEWSAFLKHADGADRTSHRSRAGLATLWSDGNVDGRSAATVTGRSMCSCS